MPRPKAAAQRQPSIAAFTRVTMPKTVTIAEPIERAHDCLKRKRGPEDQESCVPTIASLECSSTDSRVILKRPRQALDGHAAALTTPRKRARFVVEQGLLTPEATPRKLSCDGKLTSPSTITSRRPYSPSVTNLKNLHHAFLRALTLHIAHHGTTSPTRLSQLLPSASRIWGARTITLDDIRRCLALHEMGNKRRHSLGTEEDSVMSIHDYGKAGICVELGSSAMQGPKQGRAVLARVLDEEALQTTLEQNLELCWLDWSEQDQETSADDDEGDDERFLASLPMIQVPPHPSLLKSRTTNASLGQFRLDDMLRTPQKAKLVQTKIKASGDEDASGIESRALRLIQHAMGPPTPPADSFSTPQSKQSSKASARDRKSSLYARLALKASNAAATSANASGTTGDDRPIRQIEDPIQRSAFGHVPSIASTLSILAAARGGRASFGLPELVKRIKESSRSILEDSVIRAALGLLGGAKLDKGLGGNVGAGDEMKKQGLAPDFVKVVRIGDGIVGVVINGKGKPADLEKRIFEAVAVK